MFQLEVTDLKEVGKRATQGRIQIKQSSNRKMEVNELLVTVCYFYFNKLSRINNHLNLQFTKRIVVLEYAKLDFQLFCTGLEN